MQLFLTSPYPRTCAKHLDNLRLRKIIIEVAQIASTALWVSNCNIAETMFSKDKIYLPSHENHPIVKWCVGSWLNYKETIIYGFKLCDEYKYRFGSSHKTIYKLRNLWNILPDQWKDKEDGYPMPNATTHNKHIINIYRAYKQELVYKWQRDKRTPKWTGRNVPKFYQEYLNGKYDYWKYN